MDINTYSLLWTAPPIGWRPYPCPGSLLRSAPLPSALSGLPVWGFRYISSQTMGITLLLHYGLTWLLPWALHCMTNYPHNYPLVTQDIITSPLGGSGLLPWILLAVFCTPKADHDASPAGLAFRHLHLLPGALASTIPLAVPLSPVTPSPSSASSLAMTDVPTTFKSADFVFLWIDSYCRP